MKKIIFSIVIIILLSLCWFVYELYQELKGKAEWETIHIIESNNRNSNWKIIPQPFGEPFTLLGITTGDPNKPYVWVALNIEGEIKYSPQNVDFQLSCNDLKKINENFEIKENVHKFLKSKCIN